MNSIIKIALPILLFCATISSCQKKENKITTNLIENSTTIKFERDLIDFGRLNDGEKVTASFKFTNTGNSDLIITGVNANCGCTVADFPKDPIAPGKEGLITVTFDSSGNSGRLVSKQVTVAANTQPAYTVLNIKADVL